MNHEENTTYFHKQGISNSATESLLQVFSEYTDAYDHVGERLGAILAPESLKVTNNAVEINNWSVYMQNFGKGDCVDIAVSFYQDLIEKNVLAELQTNGFEVIFAQGNEPRLFSRDDENHAFLLLQKDDNVIVVDPALQIIEHLEHSKYFVRDKSKSFTFNRKPLRRIQYKVITDIEKVSTDVLDTAEAALVGVTKDKQNVVSLGFLLCTHIIPFIKIRSQKSVEYIYTFNSRLVSTSFQSDFSDEINTIISHLPENIIG